jgi:hypothetical protein
LRTRRKAIRSWEKRFRERFMRAKTQEIGGELEPAVGPQ